MTFPSFRPGFGPVSSPVYGPDEVWADQGTTDAQIAIGRHRYAQLATVASWYLVAATDPRVAPAFSVATERSAERRAVSGGGRACCDVGRRPDRNLAGAIRHLSHRQRGRWRHGAPVLPGHRSHDCAAPGFRYARSLQSILCGGTAGRTGGDAASEAAVARSRCRHRGAGRDGPLWTRDGAGLCRWSTGLAGDDRRRICAALSRGPATRLVRRLIPAVRSFGLPASMDRPDPNLRSTGHV
jgi:hypothetical protein